MKVAYLLFAYKNPQLIKRTIARLSSGDCRFFIHIDQKSAIEDFGAIKGENITYTDRIPVYWAEFSGVRAMLILMRSALAAPQRFDQLVLLSGSEYPLRSGKYIHDFLAANRGTQFINIVKMPNLRAGKPMSRITTIRHPVRNPVRRFVYRALAKAGLAQRDYRKYLGSLEPYGGNTWWALTRESCQYILDFTERNPHVAEYFELIFSPEEYYVHTVLGNSPFYARRRRALFYEDWSVGGAHPAMINENHVAFFEASPAVCLDDVHGPGEMLFARKFSDQNLAIVEKIDEMVARKDGV